MPLCKYGQGLRRIRDACGRVESRTAFKGELRFEKGDVN